MPLTKLPEIITLNKTNSPNPPLISPSVLLSLTASPFLFSIILVQSLAQTLIEVGQKSEEVFRGDRLPILHFPNSEVEVSE